MAGKIYGDFGVSTRGNVGVLVVERTIFFDSKGFLVWDVDRANVFWGCASCREVCCGNFAGAICCDDVTVGVECDACKCCGDDAVLVAERTSSADFKAAISGDAYCANFGCGGEG